MAAECPVPLELCLEVDVEIHRVEALAVRKNLRVGAVNHRVGDESAVLRNLRAGILVAPAAGRAVKHGPEIVERDGHVGRKPLSKHIELLNEREVRVHRAGRQLVVAAVHDERDRVVLSIDIVSAIDSVTVSYREHRRRGVVEYAHDVAVLCPVDLGNLSGNTEFHHGGAGDVNIDVRAHLQPHVRGIGVIAPFVPVFLEQ